MVGLGAGAAALGGVLLATAARIAHRRPIAPHLPAARPLPGTPLLLPSLPAVERRAAGRLAPRRPIAPRLPAAGAIPEPLILVPMRDEEDNVDALLESLLAQSGRPRLRVIDDASSDRTAERGRA